MNNNSYELLITRLDEFIRKFYANQIIKGLLYTVAAVVMAFLSISLLEHFGRFGTAGRSFIFYVFLAISFATLLKYILIPASKFYALGKRISHIQAAKIIGTHFRNVEDKLLNVLQLKELALTQASNQLLIAGIEQKIAELKPIPFTSAIDLSKNKKYLKYALAPVLVLLIIMIISPGMIEKSAYRIVEHNQAFEREAPFEFRISNQSLDGIRHEDYTLEVSIDGSEIPAEAFIVIGGEQFKLQRENIVNFKYLFKNLQKNVSFKLFADGFYSREYELKALAKPALLDFSMKLDFPSYTGKKPEKIINTGDVTIPAGTRITWLFHAQNATYMNLHFEDTLVKLKETGREFSFISRIYKSQNYAVSAENEFIPNADSVGYLINVVPDLSPSIGIQEYKDSTTQKMQYFKGDVQDDYGFSKLIFRFAKTSLSGKTFSGEQILPINKTLNQDRFFHTWDMSENGLEPGDKFEYYFEIWDNDGVHGPKVTRTSKMTSRIPTVDEIKEASEKNNLETKTDLQKSIKLAKDIQKDLAAMNRKLLEKKSLSWEEKKKMEDLIKKQKDLQNKVNEIQKENKSNNKESSEFTPEDERILEKQEQIEKMFEDILTDEMKEMIRELEKMMEKMDKNESMEMMEKMELSTKDIEKELDRSLELFKQLEFEKKLEDTKNKLSELSEKQEKLSEKALEKDASKEELKKEQQEIKDQFEKVKKDLDDLEKKNSELEQPNEMGDTQREEQNIDKEMKEAEENLDNKKNKKASESQKKAAEEMKDMENALQKMQDGMEMDQKGEDIDQLREILENLVQLSFDQEDVITEIKSIDRNSPNYVRITQKQKKIRDDATLIEDSLFALSKRVVEIEATINREISEINMNMDKAIANLAERQTAQAQNRQQYALTSINNLALLLSEVVKQLQEQMGKQQGTASCPKPGSGKPSPGSMKQMQQQLNKQLEQMRDKMAKMEKEKGQEKGKQKGQNQGSSGDPSMSKELAKMAAQQEAIRNQLQKMNQELNKDGKGSMGNLEKLAELMEQTETDLVNKTITQQTMKRQQDIMTRLLEAEKADREREQDDKRKSNEFKKEEFGNSELFLEYKRLKSKETELLKTVPPSVNSFYKRKITEYFNTFDE